MARYTGPTARRWRRVGQIPPDGSSTAVQRRNYPPGQHGLRRAPKPSEFSQQLNEKQKAKYTYGLLERQFVNYYRKADRRQGVTGEILMQMLERRLDNVLFRLSLATTRSQARQAVTHGHVQVNGRRVDIPSYQTKPGDTVTFGDKYRQGLKDRIDLEALKDARVPDWLKLNPSKLSGEVVSLPTRSDIDASINEQLIVEFYSR